MVFKIVVRGLFVVVLLSFAVFLTDSLQWVIAPDLPVSPGPVSRVDGCAVGQKASKVHGEYEDALIQFVNDDGTVQVNTFDGKRAILFEVKREKLTCFRKGSIVPVTIKKCAKKPNDECDFSLSHEVYVRTELVEILNWKYHKPAL